MSYCPPKLPSTLPVPATCRRWPLGIGLGLCLVASHIAAQSTAHRLFSAHLPLGEIGRVARAQGRIEPGPNQMIRIVAPEGVIVTPWDGQEDAVGQAVPRTVGLQVGYAYRFELRQIPLLLEQYLYPTIELIDRTHPPAGLEERHAITVEFTLEDLQLAAAGNLITKVVYVEPPQDAIAGSAFARSSQPYFDVAQGDDPLAVADLLGRPLAIVRIGSRDLSPGEHDPGLIPAAPPVEQPVGFTISDTAGEQVMSRHEQGDACVTCPACHQRHPANARDEYLCDGGDAGQPTRVRRDWQVDGMQMEDTVAHFDTLAGDVVVVPSTRACVYAPRFAAVRQVFRAFENQMNDVAIHERDVLAPSDHDLLLEPGAVKQPEGTVRAIGTAIGNVMEERQRGLLVDDVRPPSETSNSLLPFENLQIIELGTLDVKDTPLLLEGVAAAQVWSAVEMAQVLIDHDVAVEQDSVRAAQVELVYEMPKGKPRLRLIKLASEQDAISGDTVHFTLRFDNTGVQPIGNVTIIDKLTTRLIYVPESQKCTRAATFSASDAARDALVLKWEITEPLEPGEGGVIRFACRVD